VEVGRAVGVGGTVDVDVHAVGEEGEVVRRGRRACGLRGGESEGGGKGEVKEGVGHGSGLASWLDVRRRSDDDRIILERGCREGKDRFRLNYLPASADERREIRGDAREQICPAVQLISSSWRKTARM